MCADVAAPEAAVVGRRSGSFGALRAEVATALAMDLTEVVQNAVEHAYAGPVRGRIEVLADRTDGLRVEVRDDGAGLPAGFDLARSPRLGLKIVRTLVEGELRGTLALQAGPTGTGTCAVVQGPLAVSPAEGAPAAG